MSESKKKLKNDDNPAVEKMSKRNGNEYEFKHEELDDDSMSDSDLDLGSDTVSDSEDDLPLKASHAFSKNGKDDENDNGDEDEDKYDDVFHNDAKDSDKKSSSDDSVTISLKNVVYNIPNGNDDSNSPALISKTLAELKVDFQAKKQDIEKNKYNYFLYPNLIEIAKHINKDDYICEAYELFRKYHPLDLELWSDYFDRLTPRENEPQDEKNDMLLTLFQIALMDYYDMKLASKIAKYLVSISNMHEELWLELEHVYGIDYFGSKEIFDLKRKLIKNHADISTTKRYEMILDTYVTQLKYPTYNIVEVMEEFLQYFNKVKDELKDPKRFNIDEIKAHHENMLELRQIISEYESTMIESNGYLDLYVHILKDIVKDERFNIIGRQLLLITYERAITREPFNASIWELYIEYIVGIEENDDLRNDEILKKSQFLMQPQIIIMKRCLRNIYNLPVVLRLIQRMSNENYTYEELLGIYERAMNFAYLDGDQVEICTEFLIALLKILPYNTPEECALISKYMQDAIDYLASNADPLCECMQFWGTVEYEYLHNAELGRDIWNSLMRNHADKSSFWNKFAHLERQFNNLENAIHIYRRGLRMPYLDNFKALQANYKLMVRLYGNEDLRKSCTTYCTEMFKQKQQKQNYMKRKDFRQDDKMLNAKRRKMKAPEKVVPTEDYPPIEEDVDLNAKKQVITEKHEDMLGVFVSNLDFNVKEIDLMKALSEKLNIINIDLKRKADGKSLGYAYIQLKNEEDVAQALKMDNIPIKGRPLYISKIEHDAKQRQKFKYPTGLELKKLFIKGIPAECDENRLEELFAEFGKICDIRIVKHKSGIPKHIAFIEYETEDAAASALKALNSSEIDGCTISIEFSNPPLKQAPKKSTEKIKVRQGAKPRLDFIPTSVVRQFINSAGGSNTDGKDSECGPSTSKSAEKANAVKSDISDKKSAMKSFKTSTVTVDDDESKQKPKEKISTVDEDVDAPPTKRTRKLKNNDFRKFFN